jgi:AcrR family transcriptional regulator
MKKTTPNDTQNSPAFAAKRSTLIQRIADALLAAGVAQIPLRELAARLGTSDRMLLYYFKDKEELVQSSLMEISGRLAATLASTQSAQRSSPGAMLERIIPLFASTSVSSSLTVWADISARGYRGEEPFLTLTRESVRWWLEWLEQRLDMPPGKERRDMAAAVLTVVEGARQLATLAPDRAKQGVALLARALAREAGD